MKKYLVFAVSVVVMLLCRPALATDQSASGNLRNIYQLSDGNFAILLVNEPPACTANSPKYLHVYAGQNGVTADGLKALLAVTLTAMASGKQVNIVFSDNSMYCYVNRILVVD